MKKDLEALAQELRELIGNPTEATAVEIIVNERISDIEIHPASTNLSRTFYHLNEVVDFCRVKGMSNFVCVEINNCKAETVVHIY